MTKFWYYSRFLKEKDILTNSRNPRRCISTISNTENSVHFRICTINSLIMQILWFRGNNLYTFRNLAAVSKINKVTLFTRMRKFLWLWSTANLRYPRTFSLYPCAQRDNLPGSEAGVFDLDPVDPAGDGAGRSAATAGWTPVGVEVFREVSHPISSPPIRESWNTQNLIIR